MTENPSNKNTSIIEKQGNLFTDLNIANVNLESEFEKLNCDDENLYSNECNKFLLKKELKESNYLEEHPDEDSYLYPNLNDTNFNIKIASKKEFNDTKYDGTIHKSIKEQADILANADFELQPHQAFVKNFLSFQTPYSSMLLYHGLGTGKTCSAIGVCEDMRDYMKQMGITKRIIIVASENVQDNFRLQLFDERKLKLVDGIWNIRACTGNKLLKEINPMNMKGISREKVVSQIKNLINTYYIFLGYGQFANYIIKTMNYNEDVEREKFKKGKKGETPDKRKTGEKTRIQMAKEENVVLNKRIMNRLRNEFNNRLIVIDEVHNIRKSDDENKRVAINLELLVKSAENLRLLLLSATPMYNSYKEIIWLINLMNTNDRRGRINVKDVFDSAGNFKKNGEEILVRKATGYISFVRGENPYTFPYRVYPNVFAKDDTFPKIPYPTYQMNLKKIHHEDKKRILSLYLNKIKNCNNCGKCQYCCYKYIMYNLIVKNYSFTTKTGAVRQMPSFESMKSFNYNILQPPLESLIISYPIPGLKEVLDEMPEKKYLDEYAPSFKVAFNFEEEEDADESNIIEPKTKFKKQKRMVIEYNTDDEEKSIDNSIIPTEKTMVPTDKTKVSTDNSLDNSIILTEKTMVPTDETSPKKGGSDSSSIYIDSKQLFGKLGLERMMNFVDKKSPPEKGQFEYKKDTLDNYGRIFNQKKIGDFSSKMKTILDNIYNPETNKIGEGVVLIYSNYIDGGLIPMALALEELGFTRYGQNVKPLFKNLPTPVVDVRTMKPPTDKKDFRPARYSIISGDPRISPDNDFEVKGLTGEENKDGNKVKVILISKAGSEGIDLKFIRQVHILDPWYNMNRIEQIIGRAVRNFSHKDLPFEKRNVEIFLHGTILGDNIEEAADLYLYRVAEFKAIQIGNVSRVLKETSVDCIINHDQTNFTQKIISDTLKEPITQELSNGEIIPDFKIGDAPFSPSCDYMEICNYSCHDYLGRPYKKLDELTMNEDTYNESFIAINSEKILQRIRMLMKESFFYTKENLLKAIRTPKEYLYTQIFSALTQLIEDNNEFIVDKYGRNGRLVNIGEYYLFQPIELNDPNVSIFDRSVPIDYKHDMINFEIRKNISKPPVGKIMEEELTKTEYLEGVKIINELKKQYELTWKFTKENTVPRGVDDWYKYAGVVIKKMTKEMPESKNYLNEILVAHMMELLLFDEKISVMNYLFSLDNVEKNSFEMFAKQYFDERIIVTKNFQAFIMYKLNKKITMILNEKNTWVEAEPEDQREIELSEEAQETMKFNLENYNQIIGFIGYEKNNKYLIFKTKDMASNRDTGARCDEAGKGKTIKKINEILGETKYTSENTKAQKATENEPARDAISHAELCVLEEFLLRYFNKIKKNNKKWFLTPELAIHYKLYTVNT